MVKRIFAWETSHAAEHHFRIGMPFPLLDSTKFETARGGPSPELHDFDVVFAQRLAGPAPLWHELCADPNVLTIYDMDDDLLCIDPQNAFCYNIFHPLEEETHRNVLAADIVTVSSTGLLERYRQIHPNVVLLPICIPDELPNNPIDLSDVIVGWAGSMHKRQDWEAEDLIERLVEYSWMRQHARFEFMGADYTRGLLPGKTTITGFGLIGDYYSNMNFTIGLAPLMKSRFNDGKCHTKLIEYGARGIPTIASAVGEYREWIDHGVNGFLVHNSRQWIEALLALTEDNVRKAAGMAAWETSKQWTISKHIHKWEDVFEGKVI